MQNYIKKTLDYYEKNAQSYFEEWNNFATGYVFSVPQRFLEYLPLKSNILDLGCGTGRDSKFFLDRGYKVTSLDGSKQLCNLASKYLKRPVLNLNFLDINFENEFDGVFACASLLHLNNEDLKKALLNIFKALKNNGILYCSFKHGSETRIKEERFFNDMTKEKFETILSEINNIFNIIEVWESEQYKTHRNFINFILKKEVK